MAGLVFVVCSAIEELYRVGKVFIQSDGSFERCWKYVVETRQELFIKRYVDYLDNSDCVIGKKQFDNSNNFPSLLRNQEENSFWWGYTPDNNMAYQEIYEFTPYDVVDYASIKVSLCFIVSSYNYIIRIINNYKFLCHSL